MARYILLILFAEMVFGPALGLDLSLAPGLSVKNALLYVVLLLLCIETALGRQRKVEMLPVLGPFVLLLLYAGLTWFVIVAALDRPRYEPLRSLIALKGTLADHLFLLVVFFYGVMRPGEASWLMKGVVWIILVSSVITVVDALKILDLGIVKERADGRVMGLFGGPNESATVVAFYLPIAIALSWNVKGVARLLGALGVLAMLLSLMVFQSRGAIVGVLLGGAIAIVYLRQEISAKVLARGALVVALLLTASVSLIFSTEFGVALVDRMLEGVGSGNRFDLSSGRTGIWGIALGHMADAPITFLTGFGWNDYYQSVGTRYATHNAYLGYLHDLGTIGLTLFLFACINSIGTLRNQASRAEPTSRPYLLALAAGMICLMIGLVFCDIQIVGLYVWPAIGVGLRVGLTARVTEPARVVSKYRGPEPAGQL